MRRGFALCERWHCALRAPGVHFLLVQEMDERRHAGTPRGPVRAISLPAAKIARNLLRQNVVSRVMKSTRDIFLRPAQKCAARKADKPILNCAPRSMNFPLVGSVKDVICGNIVKNRKLHQLIVVNVPRGFHSAVRGQRNAGRAGSLPLRQPFLQS